jgi:hypothetical protein
MPSNADPQVGFLEDGVTPVFQALDTRMLYYLGPPPVRYVGYRQVEFLQMPNAPVAQTTGSSRPTRGNLNA